MKQRTIEIFIDTAGEIRMEAMGFQGPDCEQATRFLEEALGQIHSRQRKPEYHAKARSARQQKLGA